MLKCKNENKWPKNNKDVSVDASKTLKSGKY